MLFRSLCKNLEIPYPFKINKNINSVSEFCDFLRCNMRDIPYVPKQRNFKLDWEEERGDDSDAANCITCVPK